MKNSIFISFLLVLLMSSCSSLKQFRYMSKAKAPKGSFQAEIPFELKNDLIILRVKLNDSDKEYEFLLDSGAPASVIFKDALNDSKAQTVMADDVSDSQGNSVESNYVMLNMKIGNLQFKDIFTAYSAQPNEFLNCIARDGIIGANLMQTANWQIDFENKKVIISDRKKASLPDLKDFQKVSFTKRSPFGAMPWLNVLPGLTLNLKINGKLVKDVLVDLGSSGELSLPKNKLTDEIFKNDSSQVLLGYASFGLFGGHMDTTHYYTTSNISVEKLKFNTHKVDIGKNNNLLLGTNIFSDYTLFIDFRKKDLYLKPVGALEKEYVDKKRFGCYLAYDSKTKACTVGSIFEGSSAARAGLQLNDTIVEINNKKLPVFADYCEFKEWHTKLHLENEVLIIKTHRKNEAVRLEKAIVPKK